MFPSEIIQTININVSLYNSGSEDTDGIDFYANKQELENLKNEDKEQDYIMKKNLLKPI